jgi:hypothetical protein
LDLRGIGGWRELHNEFHHAGSSNIIRVVRSRKMRWAEHGEIRDAYKIVFGNLEGKREFRSSSRRWKNNNTIDLSGIVWEGLDWIHLARDGGRWRAV